MPSITQIKHNLLFGTERSLLRIQTNSKQKPMICLINLSATLWHHTKSPRVGGWVERKTKQYTISGECSKWRLMGNETRNSSCLVLEGVCCAINPFQHVLVKGGAISFLPLKYVVNFCIIKVNVSYDYLLLWSNNCIAPSFYCLDQLADGLTRRRQLADV